MALPQVLVKKKGVEFFSFFFFFLVPPFAHDCALEQCFTSDASELIIGGALLEHLIHWTC